MPAYDKADLGTRFLAFLIDVVICGVVAFVPFIGWLIAIAYILIRDGLFEGQSVGKWFFKLRVVHTEEGRKGNFMDSALRNLPLAIPFLNIIFLVAEVIFVLSDEDGIRLGDKLAKTQVTPMEGSQG